MVQLEAAEMAVVAMVAVPMMGVLELVLQEAILLQWAHQQLATFLQ